MKTLYWITGIVGVLVIIPALILFSNLIFRSQLEQLKVKLSTEYEPLIEGLTVSEIDHGEPPSDYENPSTGDLESGSEMLLYEDGSIKEGARVFDGDPGKEVIVAKNASGLDSYAFIKNDVFEYTSDRKGKKVASFSSPGFSYISFVLPVNEKYMIISGAMDNSPYPSARELWQVQYDTFHKKSLSTNPYYTFSRPPKIFVFEEFKEQVVVYYTGSYNYAFGGDSSRPKYSVIRIYNSQHPQGRDIIRFGFKAGTILEVSKEAAGYLLVGDPSPPAMAGKARLPIRKWRVRVD